MSGGINSRAISQIPAPGFSEKQREIGCCKNPQGPRLPFMSVFTKPTLNEKRTIAETSS
jgi:hypothetical protein